MTLRERWLKHPKSVLARRMLFQIHLWTGIGVGLYVFLISVSGSLLVYRPQLARKFYRQPPIVTGSGERMTLQELKQNAERAYPEYKVTEIRKGKNPDQAVEIFLEHRGTIRQRLFDPDTGADLGNALSAAYRFLSWLTDLHDNLLLGDSGRIANAVGGVLVCLLCLTGAVIWWPGVENWRRSLTIDWRTNWRRFIWELHSALGFWTVALVFLWGISGVYLSWPRPFNEIVDFLEPIDPSGKLARRGDSVLFWLSRLHFGRFGGWSGRVLWMVLGLAPPVLFVTGSIMWWNRVLRNARTADTDSRRNVSFVSPGEPDSISRSLP
jgi:uncharacterized iron-regulated membrane protein